MPGLIDDFCVDYEEEVKELEVKYASLHTDNFWNAFELEYLNLEECKFKFKTCLSQE